MSSLVKSSINAAIAAKLAIRNFAAVPLIRKVCHSALVSECITVARRIVRWSAGAAGIMWSANAQFRENTQVTPIEGGDFLLMWVYEPKAAMQLQSTTCCIKAEWDNQYTVPGASMYSL